jgi:Flp pilus assembly pilin Flp
MTALYVRIRSLWETTLTRFKKVLSDEKGATVAEYALVLVLVAVALIGILGQLGEALRIRIYDVIQQLPTPTSPE